MQAFLRNIRVVLLGFALVGAVLASPAVTQAQAHQDDRVTADFKGAVGLGLVGAELGALIPAIAGMDAWWAYVVFPVVGGAGGAVAGYFILDKPDHVEASVIALTAGMALAIPALVGTLALTAYQPGDDERENAGSVRMRPRAQKQLLASEQRARRRAMAGSGLLRLSEGELALSAPGIAVVPGPRAVSGMSLALVSGRF